MCVVEQEELRSLRQKVKEAELQTSQERYLRAKVAEDSSALVRENTLLTQKCADLEQQLMRVSDLALLWRCVVVKDV